MGLRKVSSFTVAGVPTLLASGWDGPGSFFMAATMSVEEPGPLRFAGDRVTDGLPTLLGAGSHGSRVRTLEDVGFDGLPQLSVTNVSTGPV